MDTTNQTALITGAGNGIGRAIAIAMGENKRNVVCADIDLDSAPNNSEYNQATRRGSDCGSS